MEASRGHGMPKPTTPYSPARAALDNGATILELDSTPMTGCPSAVFATLARLNNAVRQHSSRLELIGLDDALRAIARTSHGSAAVSAT